MNNTTTQNVPQSKTGLAAINAEIRAIMNLDDKPEEALYKWIDATLNIPDDLKYGTSSPVDALPAYFITKTGIAVCMAVPMLRPFLQRMNRPILCGMAKYNTESGIFLEAILLKSWPEHMRPTLKTAVEFGFARADEALMAVMQSK